MKNVKRIASVGLIMLLLVTAIGFSMVGVEAATNPPSGYCYIRAVDSTGTAGGYLNRDGSITSTPSAESKFIFHEQADYTFRIEAYSNKQYPTCLIADGTSVSYSYYFNGQTDPDTYFWRINFETYSNKVVIMSKANPAYRLTEGGSEAYLSTGTWGTTWLLEAC